MRITLHNIMIIIMIHNHNDSPNNNDNIKFISITDILIKLKRNLITNNKV